VYALSMTNTQPFLTDVNTLREQARKSIEKGAITPAYQADVQQTIDILQTRTRYRDCLRAAIHNECNCRNGYIER
jgi:hypothetical protein